MVPPRVPRVKVLRNYRHESCLHGLVLNLHIYRLDPYGWVMDLPVSHPDTWQVGPKSSGQHSPLVPLFAQTRVQSCHMAHGVRQKPSARSKLVARIQCEQLRRALLRTGHGHAFVRSHRHKWPLHSLLMWVVVCQCRTQGLYSAPRDTEACNCVSASRVWAASS